MSTNLYWKPVTKRMTGLPDALKFALRKRFMEWDQNGRVRVLFTSNSLEFFEGLKAAGVEGADRIISHIQKHGEIEVWEE